MEGPPWVGLLRRIPASQQENLVLVTTNAAEIMINSIVRLERDYMVIRGRMSGAQEGNLVIVMPFDQINYVGFAKKVSDEALAKMLGKPGQVVEFKEGEEAALDLEPEGQAATEPITVEDADQPTAGPASAENAPTPAAKPQQISKSILLARLRARLGKEGPKAT